MNWGLIIALIILACYAWVSIKRPVLIVRFLTLHVRPSDSAPTDESDTRRAARLIWTNPAEWQQEYPEQVKFYQLTGYVAIAMFFMAIMIWIAS